MSQARAQPHRGNLCSKPHRVPSILVHDVFEWPGRSGCVGREDVHAEELDDCGPQRGRGDEDASEHLRGGCTEEVATFTLKDVGEGTAQPK